MELIKSDYSYVFQVGPSAIPIVSQEQGFKFESHVPTDWTILADYQSISSVSPGLVAPCLIRPLPIAAINKKGATDTTFLDRGQTLTLARLRLPQVGGTYRFFGQLLTITLATLPQAIGASYIVGIRGFPRVAFLPYTLPYGPFGAGTEVVIPKFATHYCISPYVLGVQIRSHTGAIIQTTTDPLVNSSEYLPLPPQAFDIFDAGGAFTSNLVSFRLHG